MKQHYFKYGSFLVIITGIIGIGPLSGQSKVINHSQRVVVKKEKHEPGKTTMHLMVTTHDGDSTQTISYNGDDLNADSIIKVLMPQHHPEFNLNDSVFNQILMHGDLEQLGDLDSMFRYYDQKFRETLSDFELGYNHYQMDDSLIQTFDLHFDPLNLSQLRNLSEFQDQLNFNVDSLVQSCMQYNGNDSCTKIITIKDDGDRLIVERNGEMVFINKDSNVANVDSQIEYQTNEKGQKVIVVKTQIVLDDLTKTEQKELNKNGIETTIKEPEFGYLRFYPNPAQNQINIEFSIDKPSDTKVLISNMLGKTLYEEKLKNFEGAYSRQIDLAEFGKGTYILQIFQGRKVVTRKIIID
jgi:hypothetical protein